MLVWYVAYGSNMTWSRFRYYLEGGVLPETGRLHDGARDPSPPAADMPIWLPGRAYFATETQFWGGGRILYDPDAPGVTAGRAWLITAQQFCDIMAQEMKQAPDWDLDLPVGEGESLAVGPGHYETVTCTGTMGGHPVLTFRAPWSAGDAEPLPPSPAYRAMIETGLRETFGWTRQKAADYLESVIGEPVGA